MPPLCTASRFLSSGYFEHKPRYPPANQHCTTLTTARYSCPAAVLQAEGLEWRTTAAECMGEQPSLASALLLGFHREKQPSRRPHQPFNRTLFILGDSTQKQAADSAFCQVAAELAADARRAEPLFNKASLDHWKWRQPPWFWHTTPSDAFQKRVVSCAAARDARGAGSIRLCFIPCATLGRSVLEGRDAATVSTALRRLITRNITRATDLALINSGSWYMGQQSCASGGLYIRDCDAAQKADAAGVVQLAASFASTAPRLLWRETYATHFDTPDGVYDGNASDQLRLYARSRGASGSRDYANSRCRPLPPATAKPEVLVNVSSILTAAMDGALSTAHNRGKHDAAHAGSRSSTNRSSSSSKSSNTHVAAADRNGASAASTSAARRGSIEWLDMWSNTRNISVAAHHERRADGDLAPPDCLHFCMWLGIDEAVLAAVAWAAALEHPSPCTSELCLQ